MKMQVNGKDAQWTGEILAKWDSVSDGIPEGCEVWFANYYTPRPYIDEYNRGSKMSGFVYQTRGGGVYQVDLPL